MKRLGIIIWLSLLLTNGYSQFLDTAYYHWPYGALKAKLALRNDTLNGSADYYDFLGHHIMRCYYKNNLLDGLCIGWYAHNKLKFKGYYLDNHPFGKWSYWYRNNSPQAVQYYDSVGNPDSTWYYWYKNHHLKSISHYNHGKAVGYWYSYYKNDSLEMQAHYVADSLNGLYRKWYPDGSPQTVQYYDSAGNPDSTWYYWHKNHHLKSISHYSHGKAVGYWYSYYKNDSLEMQAHYVADSLDGLYQEWYPNGKPRYKAVFKNGKLVGVALEWYSNGNMTEECENNLNDYNKREEYKTKSDTTLILPFDKK
jgi:antitoxin component YwqK of YwqJK toxin-antitoxin module